MIRVGFELKCDAQGCAMEMTTQPQETSLRDREIQSCGLPPGWTLVIVGGVDPFKPIAERHYCVTHRIHPEGFCPPSKVVEEE